MRPQFRDTVLQILGPGLAPYGFVDDGGDSDTVWFHRTLRDHWNQLCVARDIMAVYSFEVRLYAPKTPQGIDLGDLSGGRYAWRCATTGTLVTQLKTLKSVLVSEGLTWLDTFTPGNVPLWEGHLGHHLTPIATAAGFQRMPSATPDKAVFEHPAGLAGLIVNLQVPGRLQLSMYEGPRYDPAHRVRQSPVFGYRGEHDFADAMVRAATFLKSEVGTWFTYRKYILHA